MNYAKEDNITVLFARFVWHKLYHLVQFKLASKISPCLAQEFFDFFLNLTV